ncbi:MAG: hypothetical protein KatS3mg068_1425 [Candidatus Sericytochromatia bacterium]|nr:MAG: hypothetical protein KatS3mg068_1425 [Candidatus Sericytochromatia bacterium]
MEIEYKKEGTKEYKKFKELQDAMLDKDPEIRKKAIAIYNKIMKSQYDDIIDKIKSEIDRIEGVYRKAEKKALRDAMKAEALGKKIESKVLMDKATELELSSLKVKLRHYTDLKDIEINSKIKKLKLDFYEEDYF